MAKALIDLSDDDLRDALRREAQTVQYSYNAIADEIRRLSNDRHATQSFRLAVVVGLATVVNVAVALLDVVSQRGPQP